MSDLFDPTKEASVAHLPGVRQERLGKTVNATLRAMNFRPEVEADLQSLWTEAEFKIRLVMDYALEVEALATKAANLTFEAQTDMLIEEVNRRLVEQLSEFNREQLLAILVIGVTQDIVLRLRGQVPGKEVASKLIV